MYEQSMFDFTFRDSASRQVQLFYIRSVNFSKRPAYSISYIFPLSAVFRLSSLT